VDFTTADAAGSFIFNVPIVYGFTTLKLKYYGPTGEEREEREMNMSLQCRSSNEFEWSVCWYSSGWYKPFRKGHLIMAST
jgi:hypothetical protein